MLTFNSVIRKSEVSSTQEKFEYLTAQTELYDYQSNMKTDNLRITVLIVGCAHVILILVNG